MIEQFNLDGVRFLYGTRITIPPDIWVGLGAFRYKVFSEKLGWKLPDALHSEKLEYDVYDGERSIHIVALDSDGSICGCSRLISTEDLYMLNSTFRALLTDAAPETPFIWELSRVAIQNSRGRSVSASLFCKIIAASLLTARTHGARLVIGVVSESMERLYRRAGFALTRIGPPTLHDGEVILACSMHARMEEQHPYHLDGYPRQVD